MGGDRKRKRGRERMGEEGMKEWKREQTEGSDTLPGREVMRLNYGEVGELTHTTCGA